MRRVATHSHRRRRCNWRGSAQLPSVRHRDAGPYTVQNAHARQTNVPALNQGRQASSAVRLAIQAPLIPNRTKTSGTTQHTDAPIAATIAPRSAGTDDRVEPEFMAAW